MTITEIRQLLENPYSQKEWKEFLQTHFTNGKLFGDAHSIQLMDKTISENCYSLGFYEINEYTKIGIFEVQLNDNVKLHINRVGLRNIVKGLTAQVAGAMVVFVQGDKWRFSYISKRKVRNKETNTIEDKETAPKRYTYLFGNGEKALTAAQRFERLIKKQKGNLYQFLTLDDFEEAFSVEKLSKEFFDKYKEIYEDFVEFITGKRYVKKGSKWVETVTHEAHFQLRNYFNNDEKAARDFFKRIMGRIVFLYFIQKKGWMAVPNGKEWGQGNFEYLFDLFANAKYKECFYSDYLVPLFFETLNSPASQNESNEFRFPYLNGGLFDKSQDYRYDKIALPSEIFEKLFTTFNNFNFTIYEDAPDEQTVAVDPEMLGHIFENLLEDNKDKGAFYTPKNIVHYMCRESLQNYVYTYTHNEDNEDFQSRLKQYNETFDVDLFTNDELKQIERALEDVKICDPAIGSGAFPMGLLHEIYNLKIPIEDKKGLKAKSPADLKKHIIEESIYGVDIDAGAVDIARLRFWLSLVVDEVKPQPLPNLSFKIVCANTLIPLGMDNTIQIAGATEIVKAIEKIRHDYFSASKEEKKDLEREFKNLQNKLWVTAKDWVTKKDAELYKKISEYNPFEDTSCSWFDPNWMFGVKDGFDIVIGNPPYVNIANIKDEAYRNSLRINYRVSKNKSDLYSFFFEKGTSLIKSKGILSFIVSNSWLGTDSFSLLRKLFIEETKLLYLVKCDNDVFEAQVTPIIVSFTKESVVENEIKLLQYSNNSFFELGVTTYKDIKERIAYGFSFNKSNISLKTKNGKLSDYVNFSLGIKTSDDSRFISDNVKDEDSFKLLRGKDIFRYGYSFSNKWIWYKPNLMSERKGAGVRNKDVFLASKKILIKDIAKEIQAAIDINQYFTNDTVNIIYSANPIIEMEFVVAILNSKLINKWFKENFEAGLHIKINQLGHIPIALPLSQKSFVILVEYLQILNDTEKTKQIFTHTSNERIASHIEDILNMMVYELYFEEHMKEVGIDVLQFINPEPLENSHIKEKVIGDFYLWYQMPENPVRQRILLVETRSKNIIALINKSTT